MKKLLLVPLLISVTVISCVGCQASESASDLSDDTSNTSSSDISSSGGDTLTEDELSSLIEDGTLTESTVYLNYASTIINISDEAMSESGVDLSTPKIYTLTSSEELESFYDEYKDLYSLDNTDSGITFSSLISTWSESYLDYYDVIAIVQAYEESSGLDYDYIYIEDDELKITTIKSEPESEESAAYSCTLIQIEKSLRGDAEPALVICEP